MKYRITVVGYLRGDASQNGYRIAQALCSLGHNVQSLDFNAPDLCQLILDHKSHITIVTMGREFDHSQFLTIRDKTFLVQWIPDEYGPEDEGGKWFHRIKGIYHLLMCETSGIVPLLKGFADDVIWIPQYFDQWYHWTGSRTHPSHQDIGFLGGPNIPQSSIRSNFILRLIQDEYDIRVAPTIAWSGVGINIPNKNGASDFMLVGADMADFYSHTKIGLNFLNDKLPPYELALSNRAFKTAGCGCFLLTQYIEGMEVLLYPGLHCATYDGNNYDSLKYWIDYYLDHEDARVNIAAAGKAHILKNFNIDKVVAGFIDEIEKRMS